MSQRVWSSATMPGKRWTKTRILPLVATKRPRAGHWQPDAIRVSPCQKGCRRCDRREFQLPIHGARRSPTWRRKIFLETHQIHLMAANIAPNRQRVGTVPEWWRFCGGSHRLLQLRNTCSTKRYSDVMQLWWGRRGIQEMKCAAGEYLNYICVLYGELDL